jgi:hypothetical protein
VSLGFDPASFWSLTFLELSLYFDGAARRLKREHDERAWATWHTAYLPGAKKPVKLSSLMSPKQRRDQTSQEMLEAAKAWHDLLNCGR